MMGGIDPFILSTVFLALMPAILRPKIGIQDEFTIRQAVQERQQIRALRRGKLERTNAGVLPWIFVAAAHVVIQDRIETGEAAVVHVGGGAGDVSHGGRFERTPIHGVLGDFEAADVGHLPVCADTQIVIEIRSEIDPFVAPIALGLVEENVQTADLCR
jgi:hypothetical protein